jgi:hypothetical protein
MKALNQALRACQACRSFRGHDFFEPFTSPTPQNRRWAKKVTRRADRRRSRALCAG